MFFKFYPNFYGKSKEVMVEMPRDLHDQYHKFVDMGMRMRLRCPSIYNPGGSKVFGKWLKDTGTPMGDVINELRTLTREFEKKNIKGLSGALNAAL